MSMDNIRVYGRNYFEVAIQRNGTTIRKKCSTLEEAVKERDAIFAAFPLGKTKHAIRTYCQGTECWQVELVYNIRDESAG